MMALLKLMIAGSQLSSSLQCGEKRVLYNAVKFESNLQYRYFNCLLVYHILSEKYDFPDFQTITAF